MHRRRAQYTPARAPAEGVAIVVDDGIATGMIAARPALPPCEPRIDVLPGVPM